MSDKITVVKAPLFTKGSTVYYVDSGFLVKGIVYHSELRILTEWDAEKRGYKPYTTTYSYKILAEGTTEKNRTLFNEEDIYDFATTNKEELIHVLNKGFQDKEKSRIKAELEKFENVRKEADQRISDAKKELKNLRPLLSA